MARQAENSSVSGPVGPVPKPSGEPAALSRSLEDDSPESPLDAYERRRGDSERIVCGIYVDNLQLVHSASLEDSDSEVFRFVADLKREWDIEDAGAAARRWVPPFPAPFATRPASPLSQRAPLGSATSRVSTARPPP